MIDRDRLGRISAELFGGTPRFFFAPGRVNVIGEHTDYNEGFVLPMALAMGTLVAGTRRPDRRVRAHSVNLGTSGEFDLDRPGTPRRGDWLGYVEGVAREMEKGGARLSGADLVVASDVPIGAGLSSSAALEVSAGLALSRLSGHVPDPAALARAGREAERTWLGVQSGIMDQFTAVYGKRDHALLIDCRSLAVSPIPIDTARAAVVLWDSREEHALLSSGYNTRREECRRAVEMIHKTFPKWNITSLRDVDTLALDSFDAENVAIKRAWHVVNENVRTLTVASALSRGDLDVAGRLMIESHESLSRLFEVSTERLDFLVERAIELPGVFGARMTGGGFGGCTVNLVAREALGDFCAAMSEAWSTRYPDQPVYYTADAGNGAAELAA